MRFMRVLAPAAAWLAIAGCEKPSGPQQPFQRPPAPVVVATAAAADVPFYLDEIGRCVPRESVTLHPQVSGLLTQIHFTDGAEVKAGELLFTIDPRPFQAQLAGAEASLAQSKAALELAKVDLARVQTLLEKKAVAQQELDTTRNAVVVADARLKQLEASVETARLNLEYCSLRSPIAGRTGHRLVDVGNTVTANSTALLLIQRLDPVYADFIVPEAELARVQEAMARGPLRVEVRLPDEPATPVVGSLTFVDNAIQDGTGTVKLRATVPNGDHRLWPGRFVKVRLVLSVLKDAVLVPAAAPQMSAKGSFVYVVKEDRTAEMRPVTLGQRHDERVVVEQGLRAGDRVVIIGHMGVAPGGKVKVEEPRASVETSSKEPGK